MLNMDAIKTALSQDLSIGRAGSFTRLTLPNGDFLADIDMETGRICSSLDLLTAQLDEFEASDQDIDMLTDGYAEAFCADFLPAWKKAGFTLDCVEEASADPEHIAIVARIEALCPDEATLVDRMSYLRAHLDEASGAIALA